MVRGHRCRDAGNAQRFGDRVTGDRERDVVQESLDPLHAARASVFSFAMSCPAARDTPIRRRWGLSVESIQDWPISPLMNANGSMSTGAKSSPQDPASPWKAPRVAGRTSWSAATRPAPRAAEGRTSPWEPTAKYGDFHLGLRLSVLLRGPAGFRRLAIVSLTPRPAEPPEARKLKKTRRVASAATTGSFAIRPSRGSSFRRKWALLRSPLLVEQPHQGDHGVVGGLKAWSPL